MNDPYNRFTLRLLDAVTELFEGFPETESNPPALEGIAIREVEGGPYDGMYEVVGLCRECNQAVSHLVHPDASGDELHEAFHCECRGEGGYRIPSFVRASELGGQPAFYDPDAAPSIFGNGRGV